MAEVYNFEIPGKPVGKQRPRVTRTGHVYTPEQTASYESLVKVCFRSKYKDAEPFEGPVQVVIRAYFPVPPSWSKKKRQDALNGDIRPTVKPDLDNVAKSICDALNGLAYSDDSQICDLMVFKYYGHVTLTAVSIIHW